METTNRDDIESALPDLTSTIESISRNLSMVIEEEGEVIRQKVTQDTAPIIAKAREMYRERLSRFLTEQAEAVRQEAHLAAIEIVTKAIDEKERIIDEARADGKAQGDHIAAELRQKAEADTAAYTRGARLDADRAIAEYEQLGKMKADQEVTRLIAEAKDTAENLVIEAHERIKRQTAEATRSEVKRLLDSARAEGQSIIDQARRTAEEESRRRLDKAAKDAKILAEKVASESMKDAMTKLGARLRESFDRTMSDSDD